MRTTLIGAGLLLILVFPFSSHGQLDPERRRLLEFGYNQPLQGRSPIAAYGFYYYNQPNFAQTNLTLRAAVAPVYVDAELGFNNLLGPTTDLALDLSGGGFAKSYDEIRQGDWLRGESFFGHGVAGGASIYHLFNPGDMIPLHGVVRGTLAHDFYDRDSKTDDNFKVPDGVTSFHVRTGLRYGGREPKIDAPLAMELSIWYEGEFRFNPQTYGFNDRKIEPNSHLFYTRALLAYTFSNIRHRFEASVTAGTSLNADRFSAYRLGGVLPLAAEFPLSLPGYYFRELSATRFVLLHAEYAVPIDFKERFQLLAAGSTGGLSYLSGLEQPGQWHSGLGGGLTYRARSGSWLVTLMYGHGFDAIRSGGRGSDQIGVLFQYDFEAQSKWFDPGISPYRSRALERIFRD